MIWPCFTEVAHQWPLSLFSLSSAASAIISVVFLKETLRASDLLGKITNNAPVPLARLELLLTHSLRFLSKVTLLPPALQINVLIVDVRQKRESYSIIMFTMLSV